MGNFPARSPNGSPVGLVQEPEDGSANKLAVILDAARYQSSDLKGEIAPEPVSFFPIEHKAPRPTTTQAASKTAISELTSSSVCLACPAMGAS